MYNHGLMLYKLNFYVDMAMDWVYSLKYEHSFIETHGTSILQSLWYIWWSQMIYWWIMDDNQPSFPAKALNIHYLVAPLQMHWNAH